MRYTISLFPNQIWNADSDYTDARSGKYDYVNAQLYSVWPTDSSWDTFSKIKVRVTNGYGLVITEEYTLNETATQPTDIDIIQGFLDDEKSGKIDISVVGFQFRGNSNKAAYANVYYNGR